MDVRFLIFQTDVECQNESVFNTAWHIGMPWAVIQHQTAYELSFRGSSVLHLHDLDHMKIDSIPVLVFRV